MKTRRRSRVRSSVDARLNRPVDFRLTSLAIPVVMNGELADVQAARKSRQSDSTQTKEN